jgi:ribosomal protein S18 acetylase RimI-like enzyme
MEYKVLEKQDIASMKYFVDDENTKYDEAFLEDFLGEKNAFGYVAKEKDTIVGFAFGYVLVKPDGRRDFYLHAIDIMEEYQKHGYGTELMKYIVSHTKSIGCGELFLITNKSNVSACRCYEKAGGISKVDDDIVYAFKNR